MVAFQKRYKAQDFQMGLALSSCNGKIRMAYIS